MVHREAMETEAGGFASTAISSRFPSVESRAVPDEQDAEEAAPVRQQPPATGASLAATSARPSSSMLPASASASRHGRARLGLAFGGLALVAVGSALVIFREHPVPSAPPAVAVVAPVVAPVAAVEPPPAPEPTPPPVVVAAPPAPPPVEQVETADAEEKKPAPRVPRVVKQKLTIRVRPYATVFVDGTALGQTPLAPIQVSPGEHTVRLINNDLGKDITRTIDVKAGQPNIFKYELDEN